MLIKVDEDLPNQIVELLRHRGYLTTCVVEQGMGGWCDSELWVTVQAEKQFFITGDIWT